MTTLDQFSDGEQPEPVEIPVVRKVNAVHNPHYTKEKIGYTCRILNRESEEEEGVRGYYSTRKTDPNLFRKFDSYPITLKALARAQYEGVERVVILEKDVDSGESNVYEFMLEQYLSAPTFEWERSEDGETFVDKQACASREDALHVFEDVDRRDLRPE